MIRGVVHIIGNLTIKKHYGTIRGVLIVDGAANVDKNVILNHDADLLLNPPLGYTANPNSTKMIIQAKSWSRQAVP